MAQILTRRTVTRPAMLYFQDRDWYITVGTYSITAGLSVRAPLLEVFRNFLPQ